MHHGASGVLDTRTYPESRINHPKKSRATVASAVFEAYPCDEPVISRDPGISFFVLSFLCGSRKTSVFSKLGFGLEPISKLTA
jgi:hypothetical protein